jgi:hypothetical protein
MPKRNSNAGTAADSSTPDEVTTSCQTIAKQNVSSSRVSCSCHSCKSACQNKPGWFLPDEAEKVAAFLQITMKDLFENYLAIDWYSEDGIDYYPLSPAVVGNETGAMFPYKPSGTCVFFENGSCKIHSVAPFECKKYLHTQEHNEKRERHGFVAKQWVSKSEYLENLLGYNPCPPEPESLMDMFGFWW